MLSRRRGLDKWQHGGPMVSGVGKGGIVSGGGSLAAEVDVV